MYLSNLGLRAPYNFPFSFLLPSGHHVKKCGLASVRINHVQRVQLTAGTNNVSEAILDDAATVRSPDDYSCVNDAGKTS